MFADSFIYVFKNFILIFLNVISFAFLARAILSLFDPTGEFRLSAFLYTLTEPITVPVRILCERMNWFQGIPIDVPFSLTWFLLMLVRIFLINL
ncbi:MAG: YggT family protein [Clostridia bacterium]|nr:YggT family protein [Clostridia bacterium]